MCFVREVGNIFETMVGKQLTNSNIRFVNCALHKQGTEGNLLCELVTFVSAQMFLVILTLFALLQKSLGHSPLIARPRSRRWDLMI